MPNKKNTYGTKEKRIPTEELPRYEGSRHRYGAIANIAMENVQTCLQVIQKEVNWLKKRVHRSTEDAEFYNLLALGYKVLAERRKRSINTYKGEMTKLRQKAKMAYESTDLETTENLLADVGQKKRKPKFKPRKFRALENEIGLEETGIEQHRRRIYRLIEGAIYTENENTGIYPSITDSSGAIRIIGPLLHSKKIEEVK